MYQLGVLVLSGALALSGGTLPPDDSDEEMAKDVTSDVGGRMLSLGFLSGGPAPTEDVPVSRCLGGLDAPGVLDELPGETARSVGNVYAIFDTDVTGEIVNVAVFVVDENVVSTLDWFVTLIGNDGTAGCKLEEFMTPAVERGPEPLLDFAATPDLDIGDGGARLDIKVAVPTEGEVVQFSQTFAVARQANALVVVSHVVSGEAFSDFDPEVLLQSAVDSLADSQSTD